MISDGEREEFSRIVADLRADDGRLGRPHRWWWHGRGVRRALSVVLFAVGMAFLLVGVASQQVTVGAFGFLIMLAGIAIPGPFTPIRTPRRRLRRRGPPTRQGPPPNP